MRGSVLLVAFLLAVLLAGCGSKPSRDESATEAEEQGPAPVDLALNATGGPPVLQIDGPVRIRMDGAGLRFLVVESAGPFGLAGGAWTGNETVPVAERQTLVVLRPLGVSLQGPCGAAPATLLAWHTSFGGAIAWANIPAGSYALHAWASAGGSVIIESGTPEGDPEGVAAKSAGDILPVTPYVEQTGGPQATASFSEPVPAQARGLFFGRFDSAPSIAGPDSSATTGIQDASGRTCDEAAMVALPGSPAYMTLDVRAIVDAGNHTWSGSSQVTARSQSPARAFGFLVPLPEV